MMDHHEAWKDSEVSILDHSESSAVEKGIAWVICGSDIRDAQSAGFVFMRRS